MNVIGPTAYSICFAFTSFITLNAYSFIRLFITDDFDAVQVFFSRYTAGIRVMSSFLQFTATFVGNVMENVFMFNQVFFSNLWTKNLHLLDRDACATDQFCSVICVCDSETVCITFGTRLQVLT